jgi:hypothetical protein
MQQLAHSSVVETLLKEINIGCWRTFLKSFGNNQVAAIAD